MDYITETFHIVKRKDEQKYGEYRTKRLILECYDAMAEVMKTVDLTRQCLIHRQPTPVLPIHCRKLLENI